MKLKLTLLAIFLSFSFSTQAEIKLTQSDILGTWEIDGEAKTLDKSLAKKKVNTTWTFNKDGTLIGESEDNEAHTRMGKFRASLKYRMEDGKIIRQSQPGRSKEETCTGEQKEGKQLVLKCKYTYIFMTKK